MAVAAVRNRQQPSFSENVYMTERHLGAGKVAGPFSACDFENALRASGWLKIDESSEAGELIAYEHPATQRATAVDPEWRGIHEGDPIFRLVAHDMGITLTELVSLLRRART